MRFITVFLDFFWTLFKIPIFILAIGILILITSIAIQYIYLVKFKGYKIKKGTRQVVKKTNVLYQLFVAFPRRYAKDLLEREPDFFRYQGLHIFCGEQGSGKTIALVEFMMRMQKEYPSARTMSNFGYLKQDTELVDWRQLLDYKNGFKGVIVGIDELLNWFSSNESSNFPVEMLEVVTQNRKNRRVILGTSQVFTRLAKPLREQATLIYEPITLFGCLTIVRVRKPILDSSGDVVEKKSRGWYFFVHTDELRNAYDTYKVIERLSKSGFKDRQYLPDNNIYLVNQK